MFSGYLMYTIHKIINILLLIFLFTLRGMNALRWIYTPKESERCKKWER